LISSSDRSEHFRVRYVIRILVILDATDELASREAFHRRQYIDGVQRTGNVRWRRNRYSQ